MTEVTFMPCKQAHLAYMKVAEGCTHASRAYLSPLYKSTIEGEFALSAWANGRCIGAAGIITLLPHKALAWALLAANSRRFMPQITRKVKAALELHPCRRIEMTVLCDHEAGHTWAKLIGMTLEAERMRASSPFGQDEALYARVK